MVRTLKSELESGVKGMKEDKSGIETRMRTGKWRPRLFIRMNQGTMRPEIMPTMRMTRLFVK